ncbi:hypothetical protein G9C98_007856, partial [Cotesia typhae]
MYGYTLDYSIIVMAAGYIKDVESERDITSLMSSIRRVRRGDRRDLPAKVWGSSDVHRCFLN